MKLFVLIAVALISCKSFDCHEGNWFSERLSFFDIDLLRHTTDGDKRGNIMVSPVSVRITLAMLLEGAKGVTAKEIRNALRFSKNADDRRIEVISYLNALQVNSTRIMLESANGVFVSKKLTLKKDYETAIKSEFSAEMTKIDFDDAKTASNLINGWVNQKTHGLIPNILEPAQLEASAQIILTNALYFKSSWKYSFDPQRTRPDCFYRSGECQKVSMMEVETDLPYAYVHDLQAHAVELPYEGGRYSMLLLVPMDREGCDALLRDLSFVSLTRIYSMLHTTDIILTMPKFTIDSNDDMIEPLSKMYINSLFSSSSNLSGIFDGTTASVTSFQHKVHMSVDEVGTVAAAVSAAMVVPLSFSGVEITVDKPFIFFIRDNELGIVLFEGKIEEPTAFVEPVKAESVKLEVLPSKPAVLSEPAPAPTVKPDTNGKIVFRPE